MTTEMGWLHISDIHLRTGLTEWSQDTLLAQLIADIEARYKEGAIGNTQFIILSGDIAWSGRPDEYVLAETFLDRLLKVVQLPRERLFMVPGNHDVNRNLQRLTHAGGHAILTSQKEMDDFLNYETEVQTLLQRQAAYHAFADKYCGTKGRQKIACGMGYVAFLNAGGILTCIWGINSAWMSEGGDEDRGKLLVGERQLIEATKVIEQECPALVLGIVHHPSAWLREFDQIPFDRRVSDACTVLHRGHIHEHQVSAVGHHNGNTCTIINAGAAYQGRSSPNSYNHCLIKTGSGICTVQQFLYQSGQGKFVGIEPQHVPISFFGKLDFEPAELAGAIVQIAPEAKPIASYLTALVFQKKNEVPAIISDKVVLVAPEVGREISEDANENKKVIDEFLSLRNILKVYPRTTTIIHRLNDHGNRVSAFAGWIKSLQTKDTSFATSIAQIEADCQKILKISTSTDESGHHIRQLLIEFANDNRWDELAEASSRYLKIFQDDSINFAELMRLLALCNSDGQPEYQNERKELIDRLVPLATQVMPRISLADIELLVGCLQVAGELEQAANLSIQAIRFYNPISPSFIQILRSVATESGNRELGDFLNRPKTLRGAQ